MNLRTRRLALSLTLIALALVIVSLSLNAARVSALALLQATSTATRTPFAALTATSTVAAPTATATINPQQEPRIVGVYPCNTTLDWNLRSGAGRDDLFVQITTGSATALDGYTVAILDGDGVEVCRHTFVDDTGTSPFKVVFLDEMIDAQGDACQDWPAVGSVALYEP